MDKLVNIGHQQRKTRSTLGYVLLFGAVAVSVYTLRPEVSKWLFAFVFLLFQNAILLILEGKHGVCPVNAMRGRKSMHGWFSMGKEPIEREEDAKRLKQQARSLVWRSVVWGVVATGGVYIVSLV